MVNKVSFADFGGAVAPWIHPCLQDGTRIGLHSVFLPKKDTHSYSLYLPGLVNSWIFVYLPCSF